MNTFIICTEASLFSFSSRPGYDIKSMLEDFLKYYSKAPNFARNRILFGRVVFPLADYRREGEPYIKPIELLENLLLRSEEHGFHVIHLVKCLRSLNYVCQS